MCWLKLDSFGREFIIMEEYLERVLNSDIFKSSSYQGKPITGKEVRDIANFLIKHLDIEDEMKNKVRTG